MKSGMPLLKRYGPFLCASALLSYTYTPFLTPTPLAQCYISDERRKRLQQMTTNVYVWGEGQQVDIIQDYSNYSPKNLKPFRGKGKSNVMDAAFGWYHEAYIDSQGKLWVCKKNKLPSVKVDEIDDKDRPDLI